MGTRQLSFGEVRHLILTLQGARYGKLAVRTYIVGLYAGKKKNPNHIPLTQCENVYLFHFFTNNSLLTKHELGFVLIRRFDWYIRHTTNTPIISYFNLIVTFIRTT